MQITAIGVGDAYSKLNTNASILVQVKDYKVLVDCGPTVPFELWRSYKEWLSIDAIYLTHCHPDHVLGLTMLINRMITMKRTKKLIILSHKENHKILKKLIAFAFWPKKIFINSFIEIKEAKDKGNLGLFKYQTLLTAHTVENRAIRLKHESKSILISGDGSLKKEFEEILKRTNCIIMEAQSFDKPALPGHSNFDTCKNIASKFLNASFYLYHIQDDCQNKMKKETQSISNLCVLKPKELILL